MSKPSFRLTFLTLRSTCLTLRSISGLDQLNAGSKLRLLVRAGDKSRVVEGLVRNGRERGADGARDVQRARHVVGGRVRVGRGVRRDGRAREGLAERGERSRGSPACAPRRRQRPSQLRLLRRHRARRRRNQRAGDLRGTRHGVNRSNITSRG